MLAFPNSPSCNWHPGSRKIFIFGWLSLEAGKNAGEKPRWGSASLPVQMAKLAPFEEKEWESGPNMCSRELSEAMARAFSHFQAEKRYEIDEKGRSVAIPGKIFDFARK